MPPSPSAKATTKSLVQTFIAAHPAVFRLIYEATPGLSVSRNTGIHAARFEAFTFLDDDARADEKWLERLSEALAGEEVGAAGGPIRVKWTMAKPAWFFPEFDRWVYSDLDYGPGRVRLNPSQLLFASNLAVKRSTLEKIGLFSTGLGRRGKTMLSYEEVEMQVRIHRAGFQVIYQPEAIVHHLALPERNTIAYMRRHAWNHGRSRRAYESAAGITGRSILVMPFVLAKGTAGYFLKHRMSLAKQRELIYLAGYSYQAGIDLLRPSSFEDPPGLAPAGGDRQPG